MARSIDAAQATADSVVSPGRQTSMLGIRRREAVCSTGWWVGPSSPRPIESWVNHEDLAHLHQRRHAQGVAGVFAEHQEGGGVGDQAAVQRRAVGDGGHAEFAHAVINIVAAGAAGRPGAGPQGEVGAGQVGRAAEQFGQPGAKASMAVLAGLAGGDGLGLFGDLASDGIPAWAASRRAGSPPCGGEFGGQFGELGGVGGEAGVPSASKAAPLGAGVPGFVNVGRGSRRAVVPADVGAGGGDLGGTQRGAVDVVAVLLVGAPAPMMVLQQISVGRAGLGLGGLQGGLDGDRVVAVDVAGPRASRRLRSASGCRR